MTETTAPVLDHTEERAVDPIHTAIAEKIRADSEHRARITPVEDLAALFPEMTPEQIVTHLADLVQGGNFKDVQVLIAANGTAYLYSASFIAPEAAHEKSIAEQVWGKIADKVREDSEKSICLTPLQALAELLPDVPAERTEEYAIAMADDARYQDIRQVIGPTGIAYLFSEAHMTANYATLLARIEAKDPFTTIAETVREESRVYPRPTKVELFYEPLFQIEQCQMEPLIANMLRRQEYHDIRKVVASTGAIYLYSDHYLKPGQAEYWVEWEEVGRAQNP
ncbi:MAG: hypothetical protein HZC40_20330 [Chloroflexi bacterium]|nr:hypothetical protein [Chloroflexota bacterium]